MDNLELCETYWRRALDAHAVENHSMMKKTEIYATLMGLYEKVGKTAEAESLRRRFDEVDPPVDGGKEGAEVGS
jgi:hypothetical protein